MDMNRNDARSLAVQELADAIETAVQALTSRRPRISRQPLEDTVSDGGQREELSWWALAFSGLPSPSIWLGATLTTATTLGQLVRPAIDAEDASLRDAQSACQDLFALAANALALRMSGHFSRPVKSDGVTTTDRAPGTLVGTMVVDRLAAPDGALLTVRCDQDFLRLLDEVLTPSSEAAVSPADQIAELELPVHATLGMASIRLHDVFKLGVGSVIDIRRTVSDPVDLVVNDRVIARGQVVICNGSYGVRLTHQLAGTGDDVCRLTK